MLKLEQKNLSQLSSKNILLFILSKCSVNSSVYVKFTIKLLRYIQLHMNLL